MALTVYLYIATPKGFFPAQDNGTMIATTEAAQDISYNIWAISSGQLTDVIAADPDTAAYASFWGSGQSGYTAEQRSLFIALKPIGNACRRQHLSVYRPESRETRQSLRRHDVHVGDPGCSHRRHDLQDRFPVHRCRTPI